MAVVWTREAVIKEIERETEYYAAHTRQQYRAHIGDYLQFVGPGRDWRDKDVLYNYLARAKKKGAGQAHVRYLLSGPLGCLFRAHGLRLPAKVPQFKGVSYDLSTRLAFTKEEVGALIQAVRDGGTPQQQAYFAFSTVFGLRAAEIRQLGLKDLGVTADGEPTVMIYTLKEGRARKHLIPVQITPYVLGYDYPVVSNSEVAGIFHEVREKAELSRVERKAWHAIRHAVLTQLLLTKSNVKESVIYNFMRWRLPGMFNVYFTPEAFEDDKLIYPIHPFLPFWA